MLLPSFLRRPSLEARSPLADMKTRPSRLSLSRQGTTMEQHPTPETAADISQ